MKSREIKREIGEKLKGVCESLSEKERKGVLVGMLAVSTVLCGVTVARASFLTAHQRNCRLAGMFRQIHSTGQIKTV